MRIPKQIIRCSWGLNLLLVPKEEAPRISHQTAHMWAETAKMKANSSLVLIDGNHFSRALKGTSVKNICYHNFVFYVCACVLAS